MAMDFKWKERDGEWILEPSRSSGWFISVRPVDGAFWMIFVDESPLTSRYASVQGAKREAWELIRGRGKVLFGEYNLKLLAE